MKKSEGIKSAVLSFAESVASQWGYHLDKYPPDNDPTTIVLLQPRDKVESDGPDRQEVQELIDALTNSLAEYPEPIPVVFQLYTIPTKMLYGEDKARSPLVHKIRVRTLE